MPPLDLLYWFRQFPPPSGIFVATTSLAFTKKFTKIWNLLKNLKFNCKSKKSFVKEFVGIWKINNYIQKFHNKYRKIFPMNK